jgi:hypothetical protein
MLTAREQALSAANEALSLGRGRVLGGDPGEVTAARLEAARRAQRVLRAALGTPRTLIGEADDAALTTALARVTRVGADLEVDAARYGVRW